VNALVSVVDPLPLVRTTSTVPATCAGAATVREVDDD